MFTNKRKGKDANKGFLNWLRRVRGHGVVGSDGNEGVWLYFDESDEPTHYGNGGYRSKTSRLQFH